MPKPIAICIENQVAPSRTSRYLRCVALPGRQPGLRLDKTGRVQWQRTGAPSCELWVSADDRLILYRQEGMAPVKVTRTGRSLEVPCDKPVVLLDQDQIEIGQRRLCIHIHGKAPTVFAPVPLTARSSTTTRLAQAATTAALIGSALAAGGCRELDISPALAKPTPTIEVLDAPPEVPPEPGPEEKEPSAMIQGDWTAGQAYHVEGVRNWFFGILSISGSSYYFKPDSQVSGTPLNGKLNFLIEHPAGEVEIVYTLDVTPDMAFQEFAPGDVLATIVFRSGGEVRGEFSIRVRDENTLEFVRPESEEDYWIIYKLL